MFSLKVELIKRISANLGFAPDFKPGFGLFSKDLKLKQSIKLEVDEELNIESYPIYSGICSGVSVTITNIGNSTNPYVVILFDNIIGFKLDWNYFNDVLVLTKSNNIWQEASLKHLLELCLIVEVLTDTGKIWLAPIKDEKEIYNDFISFFETIKP